MFGEVDMTKIWSLSLILMFLNLNALASTEVASIIDADRPAKNDATKITMG
jgi:hypothetical protein